VMQGEERVVTSLQAYAILGWMNGWYVSAVLARRVLQNVTAV